MGWLRILLPGLLLPALAGAQALDCNFQNYRPLDGLKAEMRSGVLQMTWQGERGQWLRAAFAVVDGQPVVRELAVDKSGKWSELARGLKP